ncbi:DUF397 domain-containing protein [Streptomyces cadmiisoli]
MEVADPFPAGVPVRDSKASAGPVICFGAVSWAAFIGGLKAGRDRP